MERLFRIMGTQIGETVESYGRPDGRVLEACRELGRQLAQARGAGKNKRA